MDITWILEIIIAVIGIMLTRYLLPMAKEKRMMQWVRIAVSAAEQIYDACQGQQKMLYVERYLEGKGFTIDTNVIEAEVNRLHHELYGKVANDGKTD